ncbi:hypothetical protein [Methanosarcina mazei]|uniref:Uncharacterized protein n=1 Tax=Methanosarcina mazei TaxID=2209 RepID=A0A0F8EG09_METMZ|nr:hypothetical protein [Methanosarcina mazei]KKF99074.1 hypothetical protein DU40_02745 [Methanosarcina mazei]KKG07005.1 hypothetical protein DU47_04130 [Methanosarcina mazei]KKH91407.1 hypothetical protein DU80_11745 [Methanosarcina mazei]NLO31065.1 hypothetical protein [Methanosarcina mazei]
MNSSENDKVWVDTGFDIDNEDKIWVEMRFSFDEYRKQLAKFGNEKEKLLSEIITDKEQIWNEMF